MSDRKRQLTPQQAAVCARLKQLWEERADRLKITQEDAAEALQMSQGAVSHYLNGRNAIGFEAMFRWAQLLRVHPYEIEPEFRQRLPVDLRAAVDTMKVDGHRQQLGNYQTHRAEPMVLHDAYGKF